MLRIMNAATLSIDGRHQGSSVRIGTWERHAEGHGESSRCCRVEGLAGVAQSFDSEPTIPHPQHAGFEDALRDIFGGMGYRRADPYRGIRAQVQST